MQQDQSSEETVRIRAMRLIKHSHSLPTEKWNTDEGARREERQGEEGDFDVATHPTVALPVPPAHSSYPLLPATPPPVDDLDADLPDEVFETSLLSTAHLMRLSGMMPAVHPASNEAPSAEEGYWPHGIHQTGALPVVNLYGREPFGRTLPTTPVPAEVPHTAQASQPAKPQPRWKAIFGHPTTRLIIGLLIGVGLLLLVAKVVNIPATWSVLKKNLATPRGITFALLCALSFVSAYTIRGMRWKLFLNPIGKVSTLKAIQLFWVGVFLNFVLPIRGGEVAKSLMLKRVSGIPISQSLPTVAMDKALDLMPVLVVIAMVPLLGVQMDIRIWLVLGAIGCILIGLIIFVALAVWKRVLAISLLQKMTGILPRGIGTKVAGFATGFVDSLLAGASQPKVFIPAILLTAVAVTFDGLFAMFAFWTIGWYIPFGTAIFGYTVYITFYILPTTPGEVGSNEVVGLLVFSGLLRQPKTLVNAMFFFSHPLTAIIMCSLGMLCLSALGLTFSNAMKVQKGDEVATLSEQGQIPLAQKQVAHV